MGKKKKQKRELFVKDYSDITIEEQIKMRLLSDRIMNGEVIDLGREGFGEELHKQNKPYMKINDRNNSDSNFDEDLILEKYIDSDDEDNDSLGEIMDTIVRCEVNRIKSKTDTACNNIKGRKPDFILKDATIIKEKKNKGDEDIRNVIGDSGIIETDDEESVGIDDNVLVEDIDEEPTLDNQFAVLTEDMDNGDLIINDAWKRYKSHSISTYNMAEATTDYTGDIYTQIRNFAHLAISIIAGPVLMIKQGNPKFRDFIKKVEDVDKERIFFLTKEDLDAKNQDGSPVIHILMYYIDRESNEILFNSLNMFEQEDDEIAIDFLYAIYSKLLDRHTNPFSQYAAIDTLIDEFYSSDDDLDFVLDLIYKDEGTVLRDNPDEISDIDAYNHFLKNIVLNSIEAFISCPKNPSGIFYILKSVMEVYMDKANPDEGKIVIPYDFGVRDKKEETHNDVEYDEVDDIDVDDIMAGHYDNCEDTSSSQVIKLDINDPVKPINTESGVKEFGSVPHNSEQRIIIDIG